eukprot:14680719-Heterocapsa_arctica.AAC.1
MTSGGGVGLNMGNGGGTVKPGNMNPGKSGGAGGIRPWTAGQGKGQQYPQQPCWSNSIQGGGQGMGFGPAQQQQPPWGQSPEQ